MQFGAIIIGDEIMSGKRQDKHMPQVISTLGKRGLELAWCQYLADEPALITATLKRTLATDDIVFSFGGIGLSFPIGGSGVQSSQLADVVVRDLSNGQVVFQSQARGGSGASAVSLVQAALRDFPNAPAGTRQVPL